ncbi:hypothetical protein GCM10022207_35900 [Streptomyces lannensis]|uniref:Uncharacterized protein n=1 Tax=Streptomyces lannensis TaxID=766498 RepID=A0ABP7K7G1_9ACTN
MGELLGRTVNFAVPRVHVPPGRYRQQGRGPDPGPRSWSGPAVLDRPVAVERSGSHDGPVVVDGPVVMERA